MTEFLTHINQLVWGVPALFLILGIGLYLSIRTGWAQFSLLPSAFRQFGQKFRKRKLSNNGVSGYQALCTALAATVGTGNLAGVAGAIAIGGPGSIFWMWICAIGGMVTKFAEATLAVHYRERTSGGEVVGGPMYMIQKGMGRRWSWLAGLYCFFGVVAAFGVGNLTQINAVITSTNSALAAFGVSESSKFNFLMGIVLAVLIGVMLLGGAKRISSIAEKLVPFAAVGYMILASGVLICRAGNIPYAFTAIIKGAFTPAAVTGGMIGSVFQALRVGSSRGVFTNEAGMGTAAIAHAAAEVAHPVEQGLMGIMEVFLDTIVICTMTALVILCSGVEITYGIDTGAALTVDAFSSIYGSWVCVAISIFLCCFAVATILGWGLYGARCAQFLFGESVWKAFVVMQIIMVLAGSVLNTAFVWLLSEIVNGLMAIPNLIALFYLSPTLFKIINEYKKDIGR